MKNESAIRELALKYFGGKAAGEEEKELFEYLGQDASHLEAFRQWGLEWAASRVCEPDTDREWRRLQARVLMRRGQEERFPARRRLLRKAVSVAAVTILGLFGAFGLWKAVEGLMPAEHYTVEVPLGEKSRIVLSDGTLVWLNAGSTLKYSDRFGRFNRRVELAGEGYFEVTKRKGSKFRVGTDAYDVVVTGTRFDVSAYPEDNFVSTTLAEGRVELHRSHPFGSTAPIMMSPGESVHYDKNAGSFVRNYVDAALAYSWTENRIEFDNITLRELTAKLSRQYNVKIYLQSDSVKEKRFHISLRNDETIRDVLDALKDIIPVRVEYKGDDIYIKE